MNRPLPKQAWQPGQSGNPAGRPKGSKNKLGEAFIVALHEKFVEHGNEVIERVIKDKPEQFLKVVAAVIPQDINFCAVENEQFDLDGLSDDDLAALERILSNAEPASKGSPDGRPN